MKLEPAKKTLHVKTPAFCIRVYVTFSNLFLFTSTCTYWIIIFSYKEQQWYKQSHRYSNIISLYSIHTVGIVTSTSGSSILGHKSWAWSMVKWDDNTLWTVFVYWLSNLKRTSHFMSLWITKETNELQQWMNSEWEHTRKTLLDNTHWPEEILILHSYRENFVW